MEKHEPPITIEELLVKICENFYAMYLLNAAKDQIIPLKLANEASSITQEKEISWSQDFRNIIRVWVHPQHTNKMLHFLSAEYVSSAFKSLTAKAELIYCQNSGSWKKAILYPMSIKEGFTEVALLILNDITETQQQYEQIIQAHELLSPQGSDYKKLFFKATADMYTSMLKINLTSGYTFQMELVDGDIVENLLSYKWEVVYQHLLSKMHPDDREEVIRKTNPEILRRVPNGEKIVYTYRSKIRGTSYRWYSSTIRISVEENLFRTATIFSIDINNDMMERARLKDVSEHDPLTDLFNRTKLEYMTETEYADLASCGVLFFDVNDLKTTNDTLGHEAGDALLRLVADSIRSIMSRYVHGYRYGGDEFIAIICNPQKNELANLLKMWQSRLTTLSETRRIPCTVAVGQAEASAPFVLSELIKTADSKMYECKKDMKQNKSIAPSIQPENEIY